MEKVIYEQFVESTDGISTKVVLTEEVNRLIVWKSEFTRSSEETTLTVLHHFADWERATAVETAVAEVMARKGK